MQITREDTGAMTAMIKLQISAVDYEESINKTLKDYQRKASVPGFRPGKVPFGMISKMYRKGILLDQINHIIAENLQKYIEENQLNLIGNPVPNRKKATEIDLDQLDFEFYFDLGFAPEFEVDLAGYEAIDYYKISATDKMIDSQIADIRHRAVHHEHPEEHDHHEGSEGEEEHHHEDLPALDEDFFNKVFPGEEIKDEDAFRARIKEALESSLIKESERYFLNSAIEKLVNDTKFDLPEDFLKIALKENQEQKMNDEEIEKQFDNFIKSVRWQLIESRIIGKHDLRVTENEIRNVVKSYFTGSLVNEEINPEQDERLNKIVDSVLSNQEETSRLHDQLFDQKLLNCLKTNMKLENKDVDYDEFFNLIAQKKS